MASSQHRQSEQTLRTPRLVAPDEGERYMMRGFGAVYKLRGAATGGQLAIVEHPLAPHALGALPHSHSREDEISYVLEGEIQVMIGEEVYEVKQGAYIVKPRGIPHAFWNPTDEPALVQELITPAGFETYFAELADILAVQGPPDVGQIVALAGRYGLTMYPERLPEIVERYGLRLE